MCIASAFSAISITIWKTNKMFCVLGNIENTYPMLRRLSQLCFDSPACPRSSLHFCSKRPAAKDAGFAASQRAEQFIGSLMPWPARKGSDAHKRSSQEIWKPSTNNASNFNATHIKEAVIAQSRSYGKANCSTALSRQTLLDKPKHAHLVDLRVYTKSGSMPHGSQGPNTMWIRIGQC